MAARKIVYSAKFRRDYVALGAVLIFFAIVLCEIALAVAIPSYLRREEAMARSVRRLELQEQFDSLRRAIRNSKVSNQTAQLELSLISWNMNQLADYLRTEVKNIPDEEVNELLTLVRDSRALVTKINQGKPISVERTITPDVYIDSLIAAEAEDKK